MQKSIEHLVHMNTVILTGRHIAKVAAAVDAGIFGYKLYLAGHQFYAGDGIVTKGVDNTIRNVCRMAREGMYQTDHEILNIMAGM